jgi:hypothetical protein
VWSWREELNLQPAVYKTAALPLSYASYRSDASMSVICHSLDPQKDYQVSVDVRCVPNGFVRIYTSIEAGLYHGGKRKDKYRSSISASG